MKAVRLRRAVSIADGINGDRGTVLFLEDGEARDAVEVDRLAEYAPEHDHLAPVQEEAAFVGPERAAERMQELVAYTEELGLYENQQQAQDDGFGTERTGQGETVEMKMPWTTASKADWIDWAVSKGCEPKTAALLTKVQLMSRYGERL
jgi:hypothetical protein